METNTNGMGQAVANSEVSVRFATVEDTGAMAALYNDSFPEHIMVQKGLLNDPQYLEGRLGNNDEKWVIAEKEGKLVGVAALAICPPVGLAEIERVCVDIPYRGNGVAYKLCEKLLEEAKTGGMGFVETFARGDQPAMQRTFEKAGFKVYGVAPRFEVVHERKVVREQFVHMGLELKPDTVDERQMQLIPLAQGLFDIINAKE